MKNIERKKHATPNKYRVAKKIFSKNGICQVTRLCESPFISQAFREQEQAERVMELEQGGRAARLKIDHLQVLIPTIGTYLRLPSAVCTRANVFFP